MFSRPVAHSKSCAVAAARTLVRRMPTVLVHPLLSSLTARALPLLKLASSSSSLSLLLCAKTVWFSTRLATSRCPLNSVSILLVQSSVRACLAYTMKIDTQTRNVQGSSGDAPCFLQMFKEIFVHQHHVTFPAHFGIVVIFSTKTPIFVHTRSRFHRAFPFFPHCSRGPTATLVSRMKMPNAPSHLFFSTKLLRHPSFRAPLPPAQVAALRAMTLPSTTANPT